MKLETPDLTDKILKPTLETQDLQHRICNTGLKHRLETQSCNAELEKQNSKPSTQNPEHITQGAKLEAKALNVYQRLA